MTMRATFDNILTDVKHAGRSLRRSPGFAAVALLALAVGIGGNTAVFTVIDATRTQAIPYENPERLVNLIGNVDRGTIERRGASYPDFLDWRTQATRSFEDLAAVDSQMLTLAGIDEPERLETEFVSASYFPLLRATAAIGRTFRADEDLVSKPSPVIVLSDRLWKRRFGADPQVLGRSVTLSGNSFTVIGVMPPQFFGNENEAELWVRLPSTRRRRTWPIAAVEDSGYSVVSGPASRWKRRRAKRAPLPRGSRASIPRRTRHGGSK